MPEINKDAPGDGTTGDDDANKGGAGAGTEGGAGKPEGTPKPITFESQEALDKVIQARVARAVPADYEDLKGKAAKYDEAQEATKSETQKAKDAQAAAETQAAERTAKADAKLRRAAILAEAAAQGSVDADTVVALLVSDADITVNDDGEVSGAKEAVKALLKSKPFLAGKAGGGTGRSGGEFGGNDQKSVREQIAELEAAGKYAEARALKVNSFGA